MAMIRPLSSAAEWDVSVGILCRVRDAFGLVVSHRPGVLRSPVCGKGTSKSVVDCVRERVDLNRRDSLIPMPVTRFHTHFLFLERTDAAATL
jgi:hypothetical protein